MTGELAIAAYVGQYAPGEAASGLAAGGTVRLRSGPRWALELGCGVAGAGLDPRAEAVLFLGNPSADVVAFVAAGGGASVSADAGAGMLLGGIGLDLTLFPWLDLRLDGRYRYTSDDASALSFTVGPQLHTRRAYDIDRDGVPDNRDRCRDRSEDLDGSGDDDGCPDPDNDRDGVDDEADVCRDAAEDQDGFLDADGCPEPDNDGDTLPDERDACAGQAEDADGFRDLDGCPDPDNDDDAVGDPGDKCPNVAEDADGWEDSDGCPDPDNDGDGVGDRFDGAPDAAENLNHFEDADGVPETIPPVLSRFLGPQPRLRFERRKLAERAMDTLELFSAVLAQYPEVRVAIVVSHLDGAQDRALTIAARLVELGVAADRIEPRGEPGEAGVRVELVP